MEQITGRLTEEERKLFGCYAGQIGLDGGTVATILLLRELRVERLAELKTRPELRPAGPTPKTITTHRFPKPDKEKFGKYVEGLELSTSRALGLLCRMELAERWLESALLK